MKVNLHWYDWLVLNSSAGKDSQAMLDVMVRQVDEQGLSRGRLVVAHADLGRVEWPGTRELAERQARHYGLRFEVVKRPQGDLLCEVRQRGKWPGPSTRYCTAHHKRGQIATLFTRLADESRKVGGTGRPVRILNCLGMRAEESPSRAKLLPFRLNRHASNGRRTVHDYLPLHGWSTTQVWHRVWDSGVPYHPAYDLGMPRLSCVFCIFAPRSALMLAGQHNPELLDEYVQVEQKVGHRFRVNLALAEVKEALARGEEPEPVKTWRM